MNKKELKRLILETIKEIHTRFIPSEGVEVKPYTTSGGSYTRFWGVYEEGNLLTVCVYKKGAETVASRIVELKKKSKYIMDDEI